MHQLHFHNLDCEPLIDEELFLREPTVGDMFVSSYYQLETIPGLFVTLYKLLQTLPKVLIFIIEDYLKCQVVKEADDHFYSVRFWFLNEYDIYLSSLPKLKQILSEEVYDSNY